MHVKFMEKCAQELFLIVHVFKLVQVAIRETPRSEQLISVTTLICSTLRIYVPEKVTEK